MLPPRLLQDHSPSGEPHDTALVQTPRSSGELLVTDSEHFSDGAQLTRKPLMQSLQGNEKPCTWLGCSGFPALRTEKGQFHEITGLMIVAIHVDPEASEIEIPG